MIEQKVLIASSDYVEIDNYIKENKIQNILLVCDGSMNFLKVNEYFKKLESNKDVKVFRFNDFQSNPLYESVVKGVKMFLTNDCDAIFGIGGGSTIDVAKCIKLYSNMEHTQNYLEQTITPNDVKLIALPTTAGTGSEATKYAVIYYNGEKQSITHESIIPSTVIFDTSVLETLPLYQKKSTLMDALCHSIESFWSVNSNEESKKYSDEAIKLIIENYSEYINGNSDKNQIMLKAANIAGKAINITQTTAGHAMCYKITSLYSISHGHAAALCVPVLWEHMVNNLDNCIDKRGKEYVLSTFNEITLSMGCDNVNSAIVKLKEIILELDLTAPKMINPLDFETLKNSVNPIRLKNNPIGLSVEDIDCIYHKIF